MENWEKGELLILPHGKVLLWYPLGKIIMEKCEEGREERGSITCTLCMI
jgi:hypothetical protein